MSMTVQELIDLLENVDDKTVHVWAVNESNEMSMKVEVDVFKDSVEIYARY